MDAIELSSRARNSIEELNSKTGILHFLVIIGYMRFCSDPESIKAEQ